MSTYYYAACDAHRVVSEVLGGRSFPDRWWQNDGNELANFLREHAECKPAPRIVSELDKRVDAYTREDDPA